jgi:hypothetical protein
MGRTGNIDIPNDQGKSPPVKHEDRPRVKNPATAESGCNETRPSLAYYSQPLSFGAVMPVSHTG